MTHSSTTDTIYQNCRVLSPEGIELFRCNKKKAIWYLSRNLAELISTEPYIIKLTFKPKGLGWAGDPFYLQDRENKCCVCGTEKDLSRHHVVPLAYRKYFPEHIKKSNFYDVLPVCRDCHSYYEKFANDKKVELANKYNTIHPDSKICPNGLFLKNQAKLNSMIRALIIHKNKVPKEKKELLRTKIKTLLNRNTIEDSELLKFVENNEEQVQMSKNHAQMVISLLDNYEDFVKEWRLHFISTMKPNFLPKYWQINRDARGR